MAERDVIINLVVKGGDTSSQQLEKVAQSEQDVAVNAGQATKALDAQTKELNENKNATKELVKQQETLKSRLKEIKLELQRLAIAGKQNTEEYKRLKAEGGNLVDVLGDVNDELKNAGSDTRGLDKAIRVATTATAAFGLVQGAAALFGDENEELQKSLLKVNAAMTVLTSLQQIQEELSRKDSVFTAAAAKAKLLYAAAVGASTGALRIFRLALIATGIGAIVVLVGLLIANWDKLTAAFGRSEDRLKSLNAEFDKNKKITDEANKARELELAILEAQGAAEDVLANKRAANAKKRFKELRDEKLKLLALKQEEINRAKNEVFLFNAKKKRAENVEKIEEKYAQKIGEVEDAINQQKVAFISAGTALSNFQKKRAEENEKAAEEAKKLREKELDDFRNAEKIYDEILKRRKANLEAVAKAGTQGLFSTTGGIADLEKFISFINEQLNNLAPGDPQQNGLIILLREAQNELEKLTRQLDEAKKGFTFKDPIIPAGTFKNTKEEIDAQKQQLGQFGLFRAQLIKKQIKDSKDAGESTTQLEQELLAANAQAAQSIANQGIEYFQKIQNARLAILQNQLKQGLISEEEYNKKVAELNRKQAIADKLKALFDIALNTAVGITAALRAVPPNPVLAALYGVLGGIQAGIVAATPIPKFRKGGDVDILKGGRERLGQLFGNSHEQGGILIEAEGGEHITRKSMAKKYRPLLHAINSDTVDSFLKPNSLAMPMPKRLSNSDIKSSRQAEKRMAELIEEVRFLSQYVRQGNKYAKVTADTNTQMVSKKTNKVYV